MTYLDEPLRIQVAESYIIHELKKVRSSDERKRAEDIQKVRQRIGDSFADLFRAAMDPVISSKDFLNDLNRDDMWRLFHALSYGLQEKDLWNCVGRPEFLWELREVNPEECTMESPGEWLRLRGLQGPVHVTTALEEAEELADHNREELLAMIRGYEEQSSEQRESDPLIGRQRPGELILIHDGNGRLQAWVARVMLGQRPRESRVRVWLGLEGRRRPSADDIATLDEAQLQVFPTT